MGLLDKLKSSILGLQGKKPQQFGVNPVPPDSLHLLYSTEGQPNVTWRPSNSLGFKPQPSTLNELDTQAPNLQPKTGVVSQVYKSKTGRRYRDLGPTEGRY